VSVGPMPRDATPARTPHTGLLALVFLALLVQIYPLKLLAAHRTSGRFSPHCDGAFAEGCSSAGKCEPATHARIWLDEGAKDKRVSGKYDVDFGAQYLDGTLLVKYRKQDWICG
jgi:hypothetical protein